MKKINLVIINKKKFIIFLCCALLIFAFCILPTAHIANSPKTKYTVVIDAGHGGIDGGCEGAITKISESTLNLAYAKCLQEKLNNFGFKVVMTRTTESGLYNPLASNKKKDDMKKRNQIIKNANADFVISIHMNSYSQTACGAQVFYGIDDEPGKLLATKIQKNFISNLQNARSEIKVGDYFMLNAISSPSVLIECGYLSNPKEEQLLLTEEYKNEVCYAILLGVLEYLQ